MASDEVLKAMAEVGKANAKAAWFVTKCAAKLVVKTAEVAAKVVSGGKA